MYSRCDYLLFVYFLILPSLLHSSILFNCFYNCFLLHLVLFINAIYMASSQLLIKWKMGGEQNSLPRLALINLCSINANPHPPPPGHEWGFATEGVKKTLPMGAYILTKLTLVEVYGTCNTQYSEYIKRHPWGRA